MKKISDILFGKTAKAITHWLTIIIAIYIVTVVVISLFK